MPSQKGGKDLDLERILAAARRPTPKTGRGAHSPLYRWMWARYSALLPGFTPPPAPNWEAITVELCALGGETLDGSGNPPSVKTVQKTWWRVCRDKEALEKEGPKRRTRRRSGGSGGEGSGGDGSGGASPPPVSAQGTLLGQGNPAPPVGRTPTAPDSLAFDPNDLQGDGDGNGWKPTFTTATPRNWTRPNPAQTGAAPSGPADGDEVVPTAANPFPTAKLRNWTPPSQRHQTDLLDPLAGKNLSDGRDNPKNNQEK